MDFEYGREKCIVGTKYGAVRGYRQDGVYIFKGMRYARAKRFEAPSEPLPWDGVRDAVAFGDTCPYMEKKVNSFKDLRAPHLYWPQDEECHYLNVWTETLDPGAKKPVLFFIHGGGYDTGNCMELTSYDGANSAKYGDMVFVSINHRLNILGHLDLSSYGDRYMNTGSLGIQDIAAALRWVRDNISGFGGDPGNVTVLGQSGGGGKIQALLACPEADGLYHKAIMQSAVFRSPFTKEQAQTVGIRVAEKLGFSKTTIDGIKSVPFAELAGAYNSIKKDLAGEGIPLTWAPVEDGYFLGMALDRGMTEYAKKVPKLIGSNICEIPVADFPKGRDLLSDEQREDILKDRFGDSAGEIISAFCEAYPDKDILDAIIIDTKFRCPTVDYLDLHARDAEAPAYSYVFAYDFPYREGEPAWHSSEMPFIFRNISATPFCHFDGAEVIEEKMAETWKAFIHTGDPNNPLLPEWLPYRQDEEYTMVFGDNDYVKKDLDRDLLGAVYDVNSRINFVHEE
ncbi:MAG: carboxylesterase/lipase family protein [Oscillospiraceae bacterium]|nr:carboxylesterase/lipase family protein [Oscillospiraceae bacterium]